MIPESQIVQSGSSGRLGWLLAPGFFVSIQIALPAHETEQSPENFSSGEFDVRI
jgi:hypothetical protein